MNIISWLLVISGSIGIGYGLTILIKQEVNLYHSGQLRHYQGQPAQLIGGGTTLAGVGALLLGAFGFSPIMLFIAIVCSLGYLGARKLADRSSTDLSLPSQKK